MSADGGSGCNQPGVSLTGCQKRKDQKKERDYARLSPFPVSPPVDRPE
jgi:hypothetical protein